MFNSTTDFIPDSSSICNILDDLNDLKNFLSLTPCNISNSSTSQKHNVTLNCFHLNIRSLRSNFDSFIALLSNCIDYLSVIVLSETWIFSEEINFYAIPDFDCFFQCRDDGRSGGIAVFTRKNLNFSKVDVSFPSAESVFLYSKRLNIGLLSVYRSHEFTISEFNLQLQSVLSDLKFNNIVLIGDLNINILNESCSDIQVYLNILSQFGFKSLINRPTRIKTCIDHIFLKSNSLLSQSAIFKSDLTDHFSILCKLGISHVLLPSDSVYKTIVNYTKFFEYLSNYKFTYQTGHSLEDQYNLFVFKMNSLQNNFKSKVNCKKKFRHEWMTSDIHSLVLRKEKLFKKTKKYPWDLIFKTAYFSTVNYLKKLIKKAKDEFYKKQFLTFATNKSKWEFVNTVILKETRENILPNADNNLTLASDFNNHFASLNSSHFSYSNDFKKYLIYNNNSFMLYDASDLEILSIINAFSNKSTKDYDQINMNIIKSFSQNNLSFITNFVNTSFKFGIFPDSLKCGFICPIYKSGNKNFLTNYRPISILPCFSKILEKAMANRLYSFYESFNFFAENQFGFLKNKSTELALLHFSKFIYDSIDKSKLTTAIFLDISKAFDNVNHSILLSKLNASGIRGTQMDWFVSYLKNRSQCVKIKNDFSSFININRGVPQGSILGPLLFLVFINDFCKLKLNAKIITYADDSVLLYSCTDSVSLNNQIEQDLKVISTWFMLNDLNLNLNKTKVMHFSLTNVNSNIVPRFHSSECQNLYMCSCPKLQLTTSIKYLGLTVDNNLKWKSHINNVTRKLRYILYKFYYLKNKVNHEFLQTLYYSWFYSIINYGIIIWGCDFKTNLQPIISIQNKCFKLLNFNQTTNLYLFRQLQLLPFRYNVLFRIILFLYRNRSLCNLKDNISIRRPSVIYNIPRHYKEIYKRHFFYIAPTVFNQLPLELQTNINYKSFKNSIFTYIINIDDIDAHFHL